MENNLHIKVIADTAWVCDMLKVGIIETYKGNTTTYTELSTTHAICMYMFTIEDSMMYKRSGLYYYLHMKLF